MIPFTDNVTVTSGQTTTATVTNTYVPQPTKVEAKKDWKDNNNEDGIRPESVTVTLYKEKGRAKEMVDQQILNEENNWQYTWYEMVTKENGMSLLYTVEQQETIEGYQTNITGNMNNGFMITNTHKVLPLGDNNHLFMGYLMMMSSLVSRKQLAIYH